MTDNAEKKQEPWWKRNKPLCVGFVLTAIYLLVWGNHFSISVFSKLELNEKGDFLAGFFAPLAFGWLVIGYIMQAKELQHSIDEMRTANKNSEDQARSIQNTEKLTKRDLFLRYTEIQVKNLEVLAKQIIMYVEEDTYNKAVGSEKNNIFMSGHGDTQLLLHESAEKIKSKANNNNYQRVTNNRKKPDIVKEYVYQYIAAYEALFDMKKNGGYDETDELKILFSHSPYEKFYEAMGALRDNYFTAVSA